MRLVSVLPDLSALVYIDLIFKSFLDKNVTSFE